MLLIPQYPSQTTAPATRFHHEIQAPRHFVSVSATIAMRPAFLTTVTAVIA